MISVAMEIEAKLKELGIILPDPPVPVANYVNAVEIGDLLFLSGTTCYEDQKPMFIGRLGAELTIEQGYVAARQTAINLLGVLKNTLGSLNRVKKIVKLNGYVNSAPEFDRQPEVINGASDLLVEIFGEKGKHARTSLGTCALPGHIPVEIELIVQAD